jgi:hypothetical protein
MQHISKFFVTLSQDVKPDLIATLVVFVLKPLVINIIETRLVFVI